MLLSDALDLESHAECCKHGGSRSIKIPKHLAIIMDGNRRWAKQKGYSTLSGHWHGANTLTEIVRYASQIGIKALTVYAFSTENWLRNPDEVKDLMGLFASYIQAKREQMQEDGVRLCSIGNTLHLPKEVQDSLRETQKATAHCNKIDLILALNYGGRDDITRAVSKVLKRCQEEGIDPTQVTEQMIHEQLDTSAWPDPDLLIRTSGEKRLSNFLLWQLSYSEVYFSPVLWPDFTSAHLDEAIASYQQRQRRFGAS